MFYDTAKLCTITDTSMALQGLQILVVLSYIQQQ